MSKLKKYKRIKYLGKGSYGAAILVELRSNPSQKFVIKEIVIGHLKESEQNSAKSEADVLHQMNHSNITMYIESFVENSKLYIVMEHADGGDLSSAIQARKKDAKYWEEEEIMRIFVQICLALKHVHNANILHRDLKSQNIFLTLKGMVKLGDFGIAKVLDATDDQARTQIGTPYYLSPEICESKPYGRESDVWSLGVLLYELVALEMPFQANSLPALVHRICSAEPKYTEIERRYSLGLMDLIKSMLYKDPQRRPSVSQIVKTDFIKTHISKLLSYTLKVGNGGVLSNQVRPNSPKPTAPTIQQQQQQSKSVQRVVNDLDSNDHDDYDDNEEERKLESMNNYQRLQDRKELKGPSQSVVPSAVSVGTSAREANRIAEREKLRKFRQEQISKVRKDNDRDEVVTTVSKDFQRYEENNKYLNYEQKDNNNYYSQNNSNNIDNSNSRVVYKPPPKVIPNQLANYNVNPRLNSPIRDNRALSPKNSNRAISPKNSNRAISPKNSNRALSPKSNARIGGAVATPLTPRSLAEHQQIIRDQEKKQFFDRQAAAGVKYQTPNISESSSSKSSQKGTVVSAIPSSNNSYDVGNSALAVVTSSNNPNNNYNRQSNDFESAARREYFANRAAAQAVKARVEAYERHGSERVILSHHHHQQQSSVAGNSNHQQLQQQSNIRRNSDSNQDLSYNNNIYSSQNHLVIASGAVGSDNDRYQQGSDQYNKGNINNLNRRSYDNDNNTYSDPEARIAFIKQQKEIEKLRENAQKEYELKEALEANREARRLTQQNKAAVAFEIDLSIATATPPISSSSPAIVSNNNQHLPIVGLRPGIRSSFSNPSLNPRFSEDNMNSNKHSAPTSSKQSRFSEDNSISNSNKYSIAPTSSKQSTFKYEDSETATTPSSVDNNDNVTKSISQKSNKKGWGPLPVDGEIQIAKGVVRYSEYSQRDLRIDQMFIPDKDIAIRNSFDKLDQASLDTIDEDLSGKQLQQRLNEEEIDPDNGGEGQLLVLKRLESKRKSQLEARQQAKEVFKKLREKKRKESEIKQHNLPLDMKIRSPAQESTTHQHQQSPTIQYTKHHHSNSNNNNTNRLSRAEEKHSSYSPSPNRVAGGTPMQIRLMEVMSQVELANESVLKAVSNSNNSNHHHVDSEYIREKRYSQSKTETTTQQQQPSSSPNHTPLSHKRNEEIVDASHHPIPAAANHYKQHAVVHSDVKDSSNNNTSYENYDDTAIEDHDDKDLEETLDHWLIQQKRGVTIRNKKHIQKEYTLMAHTAVSCKDMDDKTREIVAEEDTVEEEEGLNGYRTIDNKYKKNHTHTTIHGGHEDINYDSDHLQIQQDDQVLIDHQVNNNDKGSYLGNDVEVVGLQCMLAQALIGEEDDDNDRKF